MGKFGPVLVRRIINVIHPGNLVAREISIFRNRGTAGDSHIRQEREAEEEFGLFHLDLMVRLCMRIGHSSDEQQAAGTHVANEKDKGMVAAENWRCR